MTESGLTFGHRRTLGTGSAVFAGEQLSQIPLAFAFLGVYALAQKKDAPRSPHFYPIDFLANPEDVFSGPQYSTPYRDETFPERYRPVIKRLEESALEVRRTQKSTHGDSLLVEAGPALSVGGLFSESVYAIPSKQVDDLLVVRGRYPQFWNNHGSLSTDLRRPYLVGLDLLSKMEPNEKLYAEGGIRRKLNEVLHDLNIQSVRF